jgi:folate-binding protein YgfZ
MSLALPNDYDLEAALRAARDATVVCDLGPQHVLAVAGADAATFLQGQLSCDVMALAPSACRYGTFNSPKGRMLANFVLWRHAAGADGFNLLLPEDIVEAVAKRLRMYVLRSKVTVTDVSANLARIGVGGAAAAEVLCAATGAQPATHEVRDVDSATILALPGPRYVILSPSMDAEALCAHFAATATPVAFDVWRWLTIRAGVPVVTATTQDAFVAQAANLDILGGIDFQKGCYTGQEIIARTQYLGRLKERAFAFHSEADATPGDRLFSAVFEGQPCGTVVNAARAPDAGFDLLAVLQIAAAERGDVRLRAPDGPLLAALPLPYTIPAAKPPREREA